MIKLKRPIFVHFFQRIFLIIGRYDWATRIIKPWCDSSSMKASLAFSLEQRRQLLQYSPTKWTVLEFSRKVFECVIEKAIMEENRKRVDHQITIVFKTGLKCRFRSSEE